MFRFIKTRIDKLRIQCEGGMQTSQYARRLARMNRVEIGMYTYGSCFEPNFNVGGKVVIGRYCSFGPGVRYFGGNHPIQYASMSPYFFRKEWGFDVKDIPRQELSIGHDVWVGYGTIITSSCKSIGNGAVIAAGAVVTRNVPAYAIMMGVPAKISGFRFTEEIQKQLEKSRWWEKKPVELMKYYNIIDKPEAWADAIIHDSGGK